VKKSGRSENKKAKRIRKGRAKFYQLFL
jgi:hypothetical protein